MMIIRCTELHVCDSIRPAPGDRVSYRYSWLNDTLLSHFLHKNQGHTSPPTFWDSGHGTLRPTCYRIPMCYRNVNNAAQLCTSHVHSNGTIHAPESPLPHFFPSLWTERSHCSLFSTIGLSLLLLHPQTNQFYWHPDRFSTFFCLCVEKCPSEFQ